MKLKVFEPKTKINTINLRLVQENDTVVLQAVDEMGTKRVRGNLIIFAINETAQLCDNVNRDLGLRLTSSGKLDIT